MSLFNVGEFKLHSGETSDFKIDCDALTQADIAALAFKIQQCYTFSECIGVPRGGLRLAKELQQYTTQGVKRLLLVDDVLTTGASMEEIKRILVWQYVNIRGVVLFTRGKCPYWIEPMFKMWP